MLFISYSDRANAANTTVPVKMRGRYLRPFYR